MDLVSSSSQNDLASVLRNSVVPFYHRLPYAPIYVEMNLLLPAFAATQGISLTPRHGALSSVNACRNRRPSFYARYAPLAVASQANRRPASSENYDSRGPRPLFQRKPGAVYYTECGNCMAVYEIDPDDIGERGRKVECSVCSNQWYQRLDRLRIVPEDKMLADYPVDKKDQLIQAREKSRAEFRAQRSARYDAKFSVFVGNLPFNADEDALRELVKDTADIASVVIVKDKETGRSKGYGFLNVATEADVRAVVDKHDGMNFNGRRLALRSGKKK